MHSRRMKSGSASLSRPPPCPKIVSGGDSDIGVRDPLYNSVLGPRIRELIDPTIAVVLGLATPTR